MQPTTFGLPTTSFTKRSRLYLFAPLNDRKASCKDACQVQVAEVFV